MKQTIQIQFNVCIECPEWSQTSNRMLHDQFSLTMFVLIQFLRLQPKIMLGTKVSLVDTTSRPLTCASYEFAVVGLIIRGECRGGRGVSIGSTF